MLQAERIVARAKVPEPFRGLCAACGEERAEINRAGGEHELEGTTEEKEEEEVDRLTGRKSVSQILGSR